MTFQTCDLSPFVAKVVAQKGSLEDAASALQIFIRQLEGYLKQLKAAICVDLANAGGVRDFTDLLDVPHSYAAQAGKLVRVNSFETGLEFFTAAAGITRFTQLIDVPNTYVGSSLKGVRVNAAETALEFYLRSLIGLSDFPASYTSQALKFLRVNAGATAVEFVVAALTLLSDFPASYSGKALEWLRVNAGETATEFFTPIFTLLTDVPNSYSGAAGKLVAVNAAATALEFIVSPSGTSFSSQLDWNVGTTEANVSVGSATSQYKGGPLWTGTGTGTFPTVASTNVHTSQGGRIRNTSSTSNSSLNEWHSTTDFVWRGNAAGRGGFQFFYRFGNAVTPSTNMKCFFGLIVSAASAPVGTVDPSSFLNCIGIGCDAADTNLSIFNNDGSGSATKTPLGSSFPARTTDTLYDVVIIAPANGGNVTYSVTNLGTGAVSTGTISSDLPSTTTFLGWITWMSNGPTAGSVATAFDFTRMIVNYNP